MDHACLPDRPSNSPVHVLRDNMVCLLSKATAKVSIQSSCKDISDIYLVIGNRAIEIDHRLMFWVVATDGHGARYLRQRWGSHTDGKSAPATFVASP